MCKTDLIEHVRVPASAISNHDARLHNRIPDVANDRVRGEEVIRSCDAQSDARDSLADVVLPHRAETLEERHRDEYIVRSGIDIWNTEVRPHHYRPWRKRRPGGQAQSQSSLNPRPPIRQAVPVVVGPRAHPFLLELLELPTDVHRGIVLGVHSHGTTKTGEVCCLAVSDQQE